MRMPSRRLRELLLDDHGDLTADSIKSLADNAVVEGFDLDFKAELYGSSEANKKSLATDVAALANTAGGVLLLGVADDNVGRAIDAPGVDLTDGEKTRMRQIVAANVAPVPTFEVHLVAEASDRGFIVVVVDRSAAAPHAVIRDDSLKYPKRNGDTTRYLSEPEVAEAYQARLAGVAERAAALEGVIDTGVAQLHLAEFAWVGVSLVPEVPGHLDLDAPGFKAFRGKVLGERPMFVSDSYLRTSVAPGRFHADGGTSRDPATPAEYVSTDLYSDGSGFFANAVARVENVGPDGGDFRIASRAISASVFSGVRVLAQHAADTAAAGIATLRAGVYGPGVARRKAVLGYMSHGSFFEPYDPVVTVAESVEVATAASLDGLVSDGPAVSAAAARLSHRIGHAFGQPELGHFSPDGAVRIKYWSRDDRSRIEEWATLHGVQLSDEDLSEGAGSACPMPVASHAGTGKRLAASDPHGESLPDGASGRGVAGVGVHD